MNIRLASKITCRMVSLVLLMTAGFPRTGSATPHEHASSSEREDSRGSVNATARAENVTVVRMLSSTGAAIALSAAQAAAQRSGSKVVIAAVDAYGYLVALLRMDGAPVVSIRVAESKARTAAELKTPSLALQKLVDGGNPSFLSITSLAPLEGGIPILVDGIVVGAVGVSGMDAATDATIAKAGADAAGLTPASTR
jgi:glc operon protein GlcG